MKRIVLALVLASLAGPAWAQCTGVFPPATLCGNLGVTAAPPRAFPSSGSVVGPVTSVVGHFATWANTTGTQLADYDLLGGTQTWTAVNTFSANNIFTGSNNFSAGTQTFATVDVNGGAIDATTVGSTTPAAGAFTTLAGTTIIGSTSVQSPIVFGGTAAGSTLTLKSTSGVGTTDAINFVVGNNGATPAGSVANTGIWSMVQQFNISRNTTASPSAASSVGLYVRQANSVGTMGVFEAYGAAPTLVGRRTAGTAASPTVAVSGSDLFNFSGHGWDGDSFEEGASIELTAAQTWSGTARGSRIDFRVVPLSSTTLGTVLSILSNGHIQSTGTIPVLSSCGTSPSIQTGSTDVAGRFTVGTSASSACTLTFATAYAATPFCTVVSSTDQTVSYALSTTAITMSGIADSSLVHYTCFEP